MPIRSVTLAAVAAATAALVGCWILPSSADDAAARAKARPSVLGLPPPPRSAGSREEIALGKKLFFDRRLSFNGTMSCGMCHVPEQGFAANQLSTAVGMEGKSLRRNAPTILNVAYEKLLFRDGRETSLASQVWSPFLAPDEMAAPSVGWMLDRIAALDGYAGLFEAAYPGRGISMDTVGTAVAAYERSLVSGGSRFDQWLYGGDAEALSASEQAGYRLFTGKAGCSACHRIGERSALFSDGAFHDTGIGYSHTMGLQPASFRIRLAEGAFTDRTPADLASISGPVMNDLGRFEVTQVSEDRWAYKTPSLRNVALTAPYMHDGSIRSLQDVVEFYDKGGGESPNKSPNVRRLDLSGEEKQALVDFLNSLTGEHEVD